MTDQERELTPEQEADVRRLLAGARATEPMPADVAARLDRVLAGLGEEGFPAASGHVVAPRWRRRRATAVLVAAAAVVAIGVGIGQLDGVQDGSDDAGGSAESPVDAERAPAAAQEDGDLSAGDEAAPSPEPAGSDRASAPDLEGPVGRVREDRFTADVNQLRRAIPDGAAEGAVDGEFVQLAAGQLPSGYVLTGRTFECSPAVWGPGLLVPVFDDGTPAVLAYRPVTGESQIVDLLRCGTAEKLRSTTLKAG